MPDTKRPGADTRREIERVAVELFSTRGYEATSMREIAERVGINKASLYYHFAGKGDIVRSVMEGRGDEAAELAAWLRTQEPTPELIETTVLRWVDTFSVEKLRGIRVVTANPGLMRAMRDESDGASRLRDGLEEVADLLAAGDGDPARRLLVRMALLSINASVVAATGTETTDADIVAAAREAALALVARLTV